MSDRESRFWEDRERLTELEARFTAANINRRSLLKVVGGFAGTTAMTALLAACGGDDDDDDSGDATEESSGSDETEAPMEETEAPMEETEAADETEAASEEATESAAETEASEETEEADSTEATTGGEGDFDLADEQVFRAPKARDPLHFDYNKDLYCDGNAGTVAMLLQFDVDYGVAPDIAESFESNDDGSVWTFNIRDDSGWSNGDPLNANDYEWSFKRQLDPATEASYAGFLYSLKNAEAFNLSEEGVTVDDVGVKALDDYTLECTMETGTVYWTDVVAYIAAAPAHRASVEEYGDVWTDPNEVPEVPCSGPFKLVSWEHDVGFTMEQNPNYWNIDPVTLERVEVPIIAAEGWQLAYDNDEIDQITRGELGQLDRIMGDDQLKSEYFEFNTFGTWYLVPDPTFEPFDVPEVRHAMNHAIDREVICNQVLRGLARPAYTFQPPGTPGYMEETFPDLTAYDPEKAMSLLKGTKYEGGENWPPITLTHREEGDAPKIAADAMIAMLKENLGMDIEHEVGEPKTTYERMYNHEIQLMWVRWYIDYPDLNNMMSQVWYSAVASGSRHSWSNEEYDKLVFDARSVTDPEERKQMYVDAQKIQLEDAAAVYVYYVFAYGMNKPRVGNMPVNSAGEPTPGWNVFVRDLDWYKIVNV